MNLRQAFKYRVKLPLKRAWLRATGREPAVNPSFLDLGAHSDPFDYAYPERDSSGEPFVLDSGLCMQRQLTSPAFRYWLRRMGRSTTQMHRKLWEQAYVTQALYERGCLAPGKRGLGFAVGEEPLPAFYASFGAEITATDLDAEDARAQAWRRSGQHLSNVDEAGQNITLRSVDMNQIPTDLRDYDFTWSTCSFEHCGSIQLGLDFLRNQLECLRPGGVAVHTTEFNLSSNEKTIERGRTVLFRRRDLEETVDLLQKEGHHVEPLCFDPGDQPLDKHIDWPPYGGDHHLRLVLSRYAATSVGLILRKAPAQSSSQAA